MSETRIEVVAIGERGLYSVGAIVVSSKGDVYHISKFKKRGFHLSRHSSGKTHWKMDRKEFLSIQDGKPIKDFKGIEFLGTISFGLELLPKLFKEYKMKRSSGIFTIDMREYQNACFNMSIAIFTEQYLPKLLTASQLLERRQIFIWPDCHPMIAMIVGKVKTIEEIV